LNIKSSDISETIRNSFDFAVDKFPLSGPEGMRTPEYGLFRDDTGEYVTGRAVRKGYVPHQTEDVLALAEAATEAFEGDVNVKCHFNNGHYLSIMPTDKHRRSIFGTSDNIFPRFQIRAAYGTGAFTAVLGMFRDACMNMQELHSVESIRQTIRHSSHLRCKMGDLIDQFQNLRGQWENVVDAVKAMESNRVQFAQFLEQIYKPPTAEDSQNTVTRYTNRIEAIFKRLKTERIRTQRPALTDDWVVSGWEAYNAVQGYVQHSMPRKGDPSDFARVISAGTDSAVKKAEELAIAV